MKTILRVGFVSFYGLLTEFLSSLVMLQNEYALSIKQKFPLIQSLLYYHMNNLENTRERWRGRKERGRVGEKWERGEREKN